MAYLNRTGWKTLLDMTNKRQVTLVIGDSLIYIKSKNISLSDYLSEELYSYVEDNYSDKLHEKRITRHMSLMEWCEHDDLFESTDAGSVVEFTNSILEKLDKKNDIDYSQIEKLMDVNRFNMILSTSTLPLCDVVRSKSHKKIYYTDINEKSFRVRLYDAENGNMTNWSNSKNEILFLDLIGKDVNNNKNVFHYLNISYDDILILLFNWITAINNKITESGISSQANIAYELDKRYLLILGCELPNWLFRFMWFFMKNPTANKNTIAVNRSIFSHNLEDGFRHFYDKHKTIIINPKENNDFVNEFFDKWRQHKSDLNLRDDESVCPPPSPSNIFISYSHEDRQLFEEKLLPLLEKLKDENKITYWWDRRINGGSEWEQDIENAIKNSKIFMPFVTPNIKKQFESCSTSKYVFQEWLKAIKIDQMNKETNKMFGIKRDFIVPILIDENCGVKPFEKFSNLFLSHEDIYDRLKESVLNILSYNK